jgi:DMSO/TMAO reductase YedYZ molybdopterin-dependent catalytic subunit/thiosulfate reductase cytochrome b subunit
MALEFPWWLRLAHVFNFLFVALLIKSGIAIVGAHPRFYWNDDAIPGTEWLRTGDEPRSTNIAKERIGGEDGQKRPTAITNESGTVSEEATDGGVSTETTELPPAEDDSLGRTSEQVSREKDGVWTAEDEADPYSSWLALPGKDNLGLSRHWHFWGSAGWLLTGVLYVALLFGTGQWDRLVPTSWSVLPRAVDAFVTYAQLQIPEVTGYNALQQLTYFLVVFALSPLMIITGVLQAPAVRAHFPNAFSHVHQRARSVHFLGTIAFIIFIVIHVSLVVAHGLGEEMAKILLGSTEASHTLALALTAVWIGGVLAVLVIGNRASFKRPMATKKFLEIGVDPLLKYVFHHHTDIVDAESEIQTPSEFARVNGKSPRNDRYRTHTTENFENWTLTVDGLVENKLKLSLDDLQDLPRQSQTTRHDCIQGWTYVAQWGGVPVKEIIDRCSPAEEAEWVVFHTLDEKWEDPDVDGYYYEAIAMDKATEQGTLLADEMNHEDLPIAHGAPLRLRLRTQLGYKMAKWVTRIEFVEDFEDIGKGQGGWRDDVLNYFPNSADI